MLKIARSRRCGSSDSKLGMIGSVVRVMAAAVAEVRAAGALRQQALQLVRANRSMVTLSRRWRAVLQELLSAAVRIGKVSPKTGAFSWCTDVCAE